jgi:sugar phosphate isomerase/epimerase
MRYLLILLLMHPFMARAGDATGLFARENLVAWCIVPFDSQKRTPAQRAAMLDGLGIKRFAYDYRAEHIPTWDAELEALKKHDIELTAWWFPQVLNEEAVKALELFQKHQVKPQLWVMGGGDPVQGEAAQDARVAEEARKIRTVAEAAAPLGLKVALYNHGGWFGEPENQLAIIERLRESGITNVGIVYNLHHAHHQLDRLPVLLAKMKPHLLALNLNGMTVGGEKILPLGQGESDFEVLRTILDSGWKGPVGILNHTDEDAEARLRDNLEGLQWLVAKLEGKPAGAKPSPRSWRKAALDPVGK